MRIGCRRINQAKTGVNRWPHAVVQIDLNGSIISYITIELPWANPIHRWQLVRYFDVLRATVHVVVDVPDTWCRKLFVPYEPFKVLKRRLSALGNKKSEPGVSDVETFRVDLYVNHINATGREVSGYSKKVDQNREAQHC